MVTAVLVVLAASPLGALAGLTMLGARRRGDPWALAVVLGIVFPVTWTAWYVVDELSHQPRRRTSA